MSCQVFANLKSLLSSGIKLDDGDQTNHAHHITNQSTHSVYDHSES